MEKENIKHLVVAKNRDHLLMLIRRNIEVYGNDCDLNYIDVSNVTDMRYMFHSSEFNGDISKWDVSNAINMSYMFYRSNFNSDISNWNVSNVTEMYCMFANSDFNSDISNWNVSNVTNMHSMFDESLLKINNKLPKWYKK